MSTTKTKTKSVAQLEKEFTGLPVKDVISKSPAKIAKYYAWALLRLKAGEKFPEVIAALEMYHRNKKFLVIDDIMQFSDVADITKVFRSQVLDLSSNAARKIAKAGARKIFEDDDWVLLEPETLFASALYGKGAKWCTSVLDNDTFYEYTVNNSRIFILINKKSSDKKYNKFAIYLDQYGDNMIYDAQNREILISEMDREGIEDCDCQECRAARGQAARGQAARGKRQAKKMGGPPLDKLSEFYILAKKNSHGHNKQTKFALGKLTIAEANEYLKISDSSILVYADNQSDNVKKTMVEEIIKLDDRLRVTIQKKMSFHYDYCFKGMEEHILTIPEELFARVVGSKEHAEQMKLEIISGMKTGVPFNILTRCPENVILTSISKLKETDLVEAAKHNSAKIRAAVAGAPKTKKGIVLSLLQDKEESVRRAALEKLNKKEIQSLLKKDYKDKFSAAVALSKKLNEKELADLILGS